MSALPSTVARPTAAGSHAANPSLLHTDVTAIGRIEAVQKILDLVCRTTGMGFSAVARVTQQQWIACAVHDDIAFGLVPGGELDVNTTICNEIRQSRRLVAIDHVDEDEAYRMHSTPRRYGFQSYISVPIILPRGEFFGTLCAIDRRPARIKSTEVVSMFILFADLIGYHIDAQDRTSFSEAALLNEQHVARLREEFIAVLGHDLRNPLAAIRFGSEELLAPALGAEVNEAGQFIQRCAARMNSLIENILDLARGRLGRGLDVTLVEDAGLADALRQVIAELQVASPGREIQSVIDLPSPVRVDTHRLCQMLSNLVANGLIYGDPVTPIAVYVGCKGSAFELSVSNRGPTIPRDLIQHIFQPFRRGSLRAGQDGLGLGLYIAAQIARAHLGTLDVKSSEGQTRFTFTMPLKAS